jgi:hypothetical protein
MRWMLGIVFVAVLASFTSHAAAPPEQLALAAINALPPHDNWDRVELRGVDARSYEVIIFYKEDPDGPEEVEVDTKAVVQAILDLIVAEGDDPKKEAVGVYVHGFRRATRSSGKALLIDYGFSYYDYVDNQPVFRPNPHRPTR